MPSQAPQETHSPFDSSSQTFLIAIELPLVMNVRKDSGAFGWMFLLNITILLEKEKTKPRIINKFGKNTKRFIWK